MSVKARATLSSRMGAVLVAAGGSVGLGNIWRFPYIVGEGGGGAFLLVYLACILLLGLPIMFAEISIGRAAHRNAVGAFSALDRKSSFLGYNTVLISILIMGFYFVVSGWTLEYFTGSLAGKFSEMSDIAEYKNFFNNFVSGWGSPILYTWLCLIITHIAVAAGVEKGIERTAKYLMPLLFVILIVLSITALTMPGAKQGLEFLFKPDFSKITPKVVLLALGQAFFSLSIGLGAHITYGSYFPDKSNIRGMAVQITAIDTLVAVIAGVMIFPVVFSIPGLSHEAGPSLVFVTLPAIFNSLPFSVLWSSIFFLLLVIAALTSTISLHEVSTAYFHEEWHMPRKWAALCTTMIVGVLATVASLSVGAVPEISLFGKSLFDLLDYATANILLPIGALGTCIFVGWRLDGRVIHDQLTNWGALRFRLFGVVMFLLKYVCPIILIAIFFDNLNVI